MVSWTNYIPVAIGFLLIGYSLKYRAAGIIILPIAAIVILIGGGLWATCRKRLKKIEYEGILEKMGGREKSGGRTPGPQRRHIH